MKIRTRIEHWVCEEFGVTMEQLQSRNRKRPIVEARHLIVYMMRKYTNETYQAIGSPYDRSHANVMHSIKKIEDWTSIDYRWREIEVTLTNHLINKGVINLEYLVNEIKKPEGIIMGVYSNIRTKQAIDMLICEHYGISEHQLKGTGIKRIFTFPRALAMYLLRMHTTLSYRAIGNNYNRTYETAYDVCVNANRMMTIEGCWKDGYNNITRKMKTFTFQPELFKES